MTWKSLLGVSNTVKMSSPRYWQVVYSILEKLDRKLRIIEIGCGLGDVTTIPCYLGFDKVISFEKKS